MEEWKDITIREIAILKNGKKKPSAPGLIPVYGGNGIMGYVDSHNNENCIAIGRVGAYCGCVYLTKGKVWISDNAISAKANSNADNIFLYYLLGSLNLNRHRIGGAQPLMTQDLIGRIKVSLPSIEEQRSIASVLSALDDKIAVNRRVCENLEAQAQALFKHWFIDFAPFKNGKFVESELGMIPEGWRVGTLGEIVDLLKPSIKPQENTKYSHYSIPAFDNNKYPSYDIGETIKSNKFAIQDSVTLLSKLNPDHKRIWFVSKVGMNAICSTEFLPFYAKKREHSVFVYCYLSSRIIYREIANGAKGTTNSHQRIDANAILSRKLAYNVDTIAMFCKVADDLLKLENKTIQESFLLAKVRDTLLPKLMSGQIKI